MRVSQFGQMSRTNETLEDTNNDKTLHLPVIVAVFIVASIAVVGNGIVWYIYAFKLKNSATNFFVAALGAADFFTCVVGIPVESLVLHYYSGFYSDAGCRIARLTTGITTSTAAGIVLIIALDRYLRVCRKSGWQFDRRKARVAVLFMVVLVMFVSWPSAIIYGRHKVGVRYECFIAENITNTIYPLLFYCSMLVLYAAVSVALSALYALIAASIRRHKQQWRSRTCVPEDPNSVELNQSSSSAAEDVERQSRLQSQLSSRNQSAIHLSRTTVIMAVITFLWIISYWPHLIIVTYAIAVPDFKKSLGYVSGNLYNMSVRSYFLNYAINPFVYGLLNFHFRKQIVRMWRTSILEKCAGCRKMSKYDTE